MKISQNMIIQIPNELMLFSRSGGGGGGSSSRSSGSGSHRSSSGSRFSGGGGDRRGPGGGDRGRGGPPQKRGDELNSMRIDKPNFANMELRSFQKEFYRESTSAAGRAQVRYIIYLIIYKLGRSCRV